MQTTSQAPTRMHWANMWLWLSIYQGWLPLLEADDSSANLQSLHISRSARQPWPAPHTALRMLGRSVRFINAWMVLSMGWTMNGIAACEEQHSVVI